MALWVLFILILLSATGILVLTLGPIKTARNVGTLRLIAGIQYLMAAVLLGFRLTGNA